MKKRGSFIIACAGIATVILLTAIVGIYLVNRNAVRQVYLEKLDTAAKYLEAGDYENAILAYEELIQKEPEKEEGYAKLAGIYLEQENYTRASAVLKLGVERTGSINLRSLMQITGLKQSSSQTVTLQTMKDKEKTGEDQSKEQNVIFQVVDFREAADRDLTAQYGEKIVSGVEPGTVVKVSYAGLDGEVYYRNTAGSNAFNPATMDIYPTSHPYKIVFRSLNQWILGITAPMTREEVAEAVGVMPLVTDNRERGTKQLEFTYKFCRCLIECDDEGTITDLGGWSEIYLNGSGSEEKPSFTGQVVNARTGEGVSGAEVVFARGQGQEQTAVTDRQGYYEVEIEEGDYTIEVTAEGFQAEEFERSLQDLSNSDEGILTITPDVGANEIVIVLEWDSSPRDLDSILCWGSHQVDYTNKSEAGDGIRAELDVDEINGYGPETVTLHIENKGRAEFTYLVNNFNDDPAFPGCGATVKVYLNGEAPITYTIPFRGRGTKLWEVFSYRNGEIEEIGEVFDVDDVHYVTK